MGDLTLIHLDAARHHVAIDPEVHRQPDEQEARAGVASRLENERFAVFVAELAGRVVGLLDIEVLDDPPVGSAIRPVPTARIGIAVREDLRGQGIGSALMDHADGWARAHGCTRIILDMSASNTEALRFYERLGYQTYGFLLRKELDPTAPTRGKIR